MSKYMYEHKYGETGFAEVNSMSAYDYVHSLTKYITPEKKNNYSSGYATRFGQCQFGELDNPMMLEFEDGFKTLFS